MSESTSSTVWLPVPGFEGFYQASTTGYIRSVDRVVSVSNGRNRRLPGRLLTPYTVPPSGYLMVDLRANGIKRRVTVHTLILETFVGPRPPDKECCHDDRDVTNNNIDNLAWGSHSRNMLDKVRHGTHHCSNRERCPSEHLLCAPNLTAYSVALGWRSCLACAQATSARSRAYRAGRPFDFQAESDRRYRKIMATP